MTDQTSSRRGSGSSRDATEEFVNKLKDFNKELEGSSFAMDAALTTKRVLEAVSELDPSMVTTSKLNYATKIKDDPADAIAILLDHIEALERAMAKKSARDADVDAISESIPRILGLATPAADGRRHEPQRGYVTLLAKHGLFDYTDAKLKQQLNQAGCASVSRVVEHLASRPPPLTPVGNICRPRRCPNRCRTPKYGQGGARTRWPRQPRSVRH